MDGCCRNCANVLLWGRVCWQCVRMLLLGVWLGATIVYAIDLAGGFK